jgi:hypothetical protein
MLVSVFESGTWNRAPPGIVQAHVADAEVAQLAVSYAAVAKNPNHERATHVAGGALDPEAPGVVVDGGRR